MTDDPSIRVAAENRGDAGGADRERCHRRCAGRIHNNVRKKIARGYQNGHERCVRRRNLRYSRRPVQYLQRLRHHAGGVPSNIVDHPHRLETISHLLCCIWCYITSKISLNWIIASRERKKERVGCSLWIIIYPVPGNFPDPKIRRCIDDIRPTHSDHLLETIPRTRNSCHSREYTKERKFFPFMVPKINK